MALLDLQKLEAIKDESTAPASLSALSLIGCISSISFIICL